MRYGLPYKGSKNGIAEWVVANLPRAEIFVDLFFGGGAITHRAMLEQKYKRFIVNDIDARLPKLFVDCAYGKYTVENHPEWVTRAEFNERKNDDAYIALVWSFANNGKDYLYGADIEEMKHQYHKAVFENDLDGLRAFGFELVKSDASGIYDRYLDYQRQIKRQTDLIQNDIATRQTEIERLQGLSSLLRLQSMQSLQSLQSYGTDYQNVPIPDGALIYCDIPYTGTNCGKYGGFDHKRFYEWAEQQENIYISEYEMPDAFIPYAWIDKMVLSAATGNEMTGREIIFTNRKTYEKLSDLDRFRMSLNFAEQMNIFDFINKEAN